MGQTERHHKIKNRLDAGQFLSKRELLAEFEVSESTLKRDMAYVRERMDVPLAFDRERGGWRLDAAAAKGGGYALGVQLREDEIHALLSMQHLLSQLEPGGLLGAQVAALQRQLGRLLDKGLRAPVDVARRIRVLALGARPLPLAHFQAVATAVLRRRRLHLRYRAFSTGVVSQREVSPQRLVHYRDNWLLDGLCHMRSDLRSFRLDAIEHVQVLEAPATEVPDTELDEVLSKGYGIFAGRDVRWARLRFSPFAARWVANARWHPDQRGRYDNHGHWLLDLPYADDRELVMDILRHVPEVEVL